jgi:hypothetical protein
MLEKCLAIVAVAGEKHAPRGKRPEDLKAFLLDD